MFLHAGELSIEDPKTSKRLTLNSRFPKDWNALFERFDWQTPK
jgi:hypothetical protein